MVLYGLTGQTATALLWSVVFQDSIHLDTPYHQKLPCFQFIFKGAVFVRITCGGFPAGSGIDDEHKSPERCENVSLMAAAGLRTARCSRQKC